MSSLQEDLIGNIQLYVNQGIEAEEQRRLEEQRQNESVDEWELFKDIQKPNNNAQDTIDTDINLP